MNVFIASKCSRDPTDLVGFSHGAAVATFIAAECPNLVRSVVLLAGFVSSHDARQKMQFELWRDLIRIDRRAMARFLLITGFSPDFLSTFSDTAINEAVADMVANNSWEGMARQVELDLTIDVRDQAQRIRKPALIIGCRHDHMSLRPMRRNSRLSFPARDIGKWRRAISPRWSSRKHWQRWCSIFFAVKAPDVGSSSGDLGDFVAQTAEYLPMGCGAGSCSPQTGDQSA